MRLEELRQFFVRHEQALFVGAVLVVLAIGVWARLAGYFSPALGFWLDEADWAERAIEGDFASPTRPEGFMWLSHLIATTSATEQALRSVSLIAGLLSLPVMLLLLREMTGSRWVAVFGLYFFAVHRVAVTMAKEFKPYSFELFLHLLLLWLAVVYLRRGNRAALIVGCMLAPFLFWFAWSIVFVFPAFFLLLGLGALGRHRFHELALAALSSGLSLLVVVSIYLERLSNREDNAGYWARKYDVFFAGESAHAGALWYLERTLGLIAFPTHLKYAQGAELLAGLLPVLAVGLAVLATSALLRRERWPLALAIFLPLGVMVAISALGSWPYGVFRTNTFTLAYSFPLVAVGIAELSRRVRSRAETWAERRAAPERAPLASTALAMIALLVVVGCLPYAPARFATKEPGDLAYTSGVRGALEVIHAWEREHGGLKARTENRTPVFLDLHACGIFEFYVEQHDETEDEFGPLVERRLDPECHGKLSGELMKAARGEHPFWVLTARLGYGRGMMKYLEPCDITVERELPYDNVLVRCEPRKPGTAHASRG